MKKYHLFTGYDYDGTDYNGSFETLDLALVVALEHPYDHAYIMMAGDDGALQFAHDLKRTLDEDGNNYGQWEEWVVKTC